MTRLIVNVDVDDIERAKAFYMSIFDLKLFRQFEGGYCELAGENASLFLLSKPKDSLVYPGSTARRDYARHWTPVHIDFEVKDIEEAFDKAKAYGASGADTAVIRENVWGKIVELGDPFGNGFCIIEFTGRGYDEIASSPTSEAQV